MVSGSCALPPRWPPQCSCVVIESSFDPGEQLQAPGSLWLVHLVFRPCELLPSLFVRRPSVNISHFNLLLRNHWANYNQTLVEWSLDGPLPKRCPVIPTSNQDGHQAKNRKKGDEIKKKSSPLKLLSQSQPNFAETILG